MRMRVLQARSQFGSKYVYSRTGNTLARLTNIQEAWLAANAVSEEDKLGTQEGREKEDRPDDPMQGLEGLDVAGPRMN